jgi:hypothetical protein
VRESDFVIATHRDDPAALAGLVALATFAPSGRYNGPPITAYEVPEALKRRVDISLPGAAHQASSGAAALPAVTDGDPATWWHTDQIQRAGDFLSLDLGREEEVWGIEMQLADAPRFAAREWTLEARRGGTWWRQPWSAGRTRPESQWLPASQVMLLDPPVRIDALRITLTRNSGRRWGTAGLRLWRSAP